MRNVTCTCGTIIAIAGPGTWYCPACGDQLDVGTKPAGYHGEAIDVRLVSPPWIELDDIDEPELVTCLDCGGPGCELGQLGPLTWYRCRDCGIEWSIGGAS